MRRKTTRRSYEDNFGYSLDPADKARLIRPSNFDKLPPKEQWEIDKKLGILDWNG
jgi:hypothetical protein